MKLIVGRDKLDEIQVGTFHLLPTLVFTLHFLRSAFRASGTNYKPLRHSWRSTPNGKAKSS